jgi:hypothetical protein
MLHIVTLYVVSEEVLAGFIAAVRNGTWHALARQLQPNLIATDVLERQDSQYLMCIDFWASPEAYAAALNSPSFGTLFQFRRNMAQSSFELGAFTHPARVASGS